MTTTIESARHTSQPEYAIYTFEPAERGRKVWTRHAVWPDMHAAIGQAEQLYASRKFVKVEVTKKFFDNRRHRMVNSTLKVFETPKGLAARTVFYSALTVILGFGAVVFLALS